MEPRSLLTSMRLRAQTRAHTLDTRSPDEDTWMENSVELCGGTHITNTKEALAFSLIQVRAGSRM